MAGRRVLLGLVFLALIGGTLYYASSFLFKRSSEIILNGNVEVQNVNVSFRLSGRISKILVEEGDNIKMGDVLAVLDCDVLQLRFELAKARMEEAIANLKISEKNLTRAKALFKKKSISEKIFDEYVLAYETAKAKRNITVSNYKLAQIHCNDAVLKSPVDGVILTRGIELGEMISIGMPAFTIMPNAHTKVKTFATEEVLCKLKYNDPVTVHIDCLPDKVFRGHISLISSSAEFTPKNIETKELRTSLMYRVRVVIDDDAPELKQGMPVVIKYPANG
ncbi:MAG: efflux RND transporter periplasmic adaptor subunit [Holosporales bacterium]|nr:efflux RND transporter periplasmic adaptor subunit [Holosporales bacterium]